MKCYKRKCVQERKRQRDWVSRLKKTILKLLRFIGRRGKIKSFALVCTLYANFIINEIEREREKRKKIFEGKFCVKNKQISHFLKVGCSIFPFFVAVTGDENANSASTGTHYIKMWSGHEMKKINMKNVFSS